MHPKSIAIFLSQVLQDHLHAFSYTRKYKQVTRFIMGFMDFPMTPVLISLSLKLDLSIEVIISVKKVNFKN